jgi:predicted nucleic acid-binding protein
VKTDFEWGGPLYLDSSALVKIYLPETGSEALEAPLVGRRDLVVSELAVTEVVSALTRRKREGSLDAAAVTRLHRAVLHDIDAGYYRSLDLAPAIHREAERLLVLFERVPLRAADALHLALAASAGCATVVTFDHRMTEAAPHLGLTSVP